MRGSLSPRAPDICSVRRFLASQRRQNRIAQERVCSARSRSVRQRYSSLPFSWHLSSLPCVYLGWHWQRLSGVVELDKFASPLTRDVDESRLQPGPPWRPSLQAGYDYCPDAIELCHLLLARTAQVSRQVAFVRDHTPSTLDAHSPSAPFQHTPHDDSTSTLRDREVLPSVPAIMFLFRSYTPRWPIAQAMWVHQVL